MRETGLVSTPLPATPVMACRTPFAPAQQPVHGSDQVEQPLRAKAVTEAIEAAVEGEELQSVKEEELDNVMLEGAADRLSLFPVELVAADVIEVESSSAQALAVIAPHPCHCQRNQTSGTRKMCLKLRTTSSIPK